MYFHMDIYITTIYVYIIIFAKAFAKTSTAKTFIAKRPSQRPPPSEQGATPKSLAGSGHDDEHYDGRHDGRYDECYEGSHFI